MKPCWQVNICIKYCFFPLVRFGPRFPALSSAYDRFLVKTALETGRELGYNFLKEGVYFAQVGPAFETPAECRFLSMVSTGDKFFTLVDSQAHITSGKRLEGIYMKSCSFE